MKTPCCLFSPAASSGRRAALWFVILSAAALRLGAASVESVAISSTAAPTYVRATDAQGKPAPETYIFMQGHYLGGTAADASETKMNFATITKYLALNLAKQNYFPTKEVAAAHVIITVHWGTTQIYEDPRGKEYLTEQLNRELASVNEAVAEGGMADTGGINQALSEGQSTVQSQDGAIARNAALLGYDRALSKEKRKMMPTSEELTMSVELNEERYFVILMAYDYQHMRREKKPKLLWVTRLSLRSPGNNFTEAMPTLALAGADIYGRQLNGLVRVKVPVQGGQVKLHDLEILGSEEKTAPAEKPAK